jgi:Zn-dependent protease/predicted transcriptional regulator
MTGSIRVFRIAGIDIYINFSWIIILVFLTFSLATGWFATLYPGWQPATYWLVSFIAAILLFVSVLLHELAHSFVARARGLPVKSIVLFIFGGVSNIEREPGSPGVEFQMAFVGPLTSLLIGVVCYLLLLLLRGSNSPVAAILGYLAVTNILLGIFNLIPGFPLDGGRVLRSIVWRISGNLSTATRVANVVGQIIAYLFILIGIIFFFNGDFLDGIWLGFIGWFLLSSAHSASTQTMLQTSFQGVTVSQIMNTSPMTVPANISLQRLIHEYFIPQGLRSALVMQGDQLAGLVTLSDVRHVPQEQWAQTPVGFVMIALDKLHTVSPDQQLNDVLPLITSRDVNQLPVVQNGHLVGILSRDSIMRFLEVRRDQHLDRTT